MRKANHPKPPKKDLHILEEFDDYLNMNLRQDNDAFDNSKEVIASPTGHHNMTFSLSEDIAQNKPK